MLITAKILKKHKVCTSQVKVFEQIWPTGMETTVDNMLKTIKMKLDINLFVDNILTARAQQAYNKAIIPALRDFRKSKRLVQQDYLKGKELAELAYKKEFTRQPYDKKLILAQQAYDKWIRLPQQAYNKDIIPARDAYDKAVAVVFVQVLETLNY